MSRRRKRREPKSAQRPSDLDKAQLPKTGVLSTAIVVCFFLSGFAALIYQVAWLRQFSIVFGTSELAVATVLAAYMAGLAGGAAISRRLLMKTKRPVMTYAVLEGGIALSALAVPLLLAAASALYVWVLGGQPEPPSSQGIGQPIFYLVVTFIVLAVPTGLMGATLPLLTRHVVREDIQVGPRMAGLYAVNTLGAVAGTLFAAFVLLPRLGLFWTVACGALTNLFIFGVASRVGRLVPAGHAESLEAQASPAIATGNASRPPKYLTGSISGAQWVLPILWVSGAVSFLYEVLWTRLLSHVIGGSIYAFALMLAAFLSGIAIGGGLGGLAARRRQGAAIWLAASQVGIGVLAAAVYVWMQRLIPAERGLVEFGAYAVAVMFPAALLIGATLPLGVRVLAASASDAGESTARVYVWNTTGAIFGSILAGFVVIPQLGFEGAIRLGVTLNLGLALACVLLLFTPRWRLAAPATALLLAAFVWYRPQRPDVVIANSAIQEAPAVGATEVFYAVGVSATVFAIESDGEIAIRTNGLPEASVPVKGSPQVGQVQHWLTALPIAARPEAESLLLVGLGGGVALEGVPRSVTDIDVIELEPQVVAANRAIADQRTVDPLQDARIAVIVNDARNALRLTSKRYDIIVSQPSHPWTAGASHLYTREFVNLSKQHLRDEGVFLQWVGAGFIDEPLLQSMTANLVERFANVRLYQANGSILFLLASDGDLGIEARVASTGQPLLDNLLWYSYMGLNGVEDFAAALVMDESATRRFSEGAGALTDDRNRMATHSHYLADGFKATELVESLAQYDMLAVDSRAFLSAIPGGVDAVAVANRLLRDGFRTRVGRFAAGLEEGPERLFIGGLLDGVRGRLDEARTAFAAALEADPFADYARYALIEPALPAIASGRADAEAMGLVRGLRGSAAAVVRGWELAGKQDVASLAALDRALGAADPRDLWYPEAVQLRADWRTRANDNARAADDALRMIDRALLIRPKPELLLLRAAAADVLDDDAAFVESVRAYLNLLLARLNDQSMPMTSTEAMFTDRRLFALRAKLDVIGAKSRRAREVAESATHLLETLSRRR